MSAGRGGSPRSSFQRFVDALANTGLRHQIRGDHVQSECPTHTDNHPSLSGDYKPNDGQTVFMCQAGCTSDEVRAALALTWPELFDDYEDPEVFAERRAQERAADPSSRRRSGRTKRPRRTAPKQPALPKGRLPDRLTEAKPRPLGEWAITTTYDYCDTAATLVQQEVRYERPIEVVDDSTGQTRTSVEKRFTQRWPARDGSWLEQTPAGFSPVLYRLPDLTEWISQGRRIWLCEGAKDAERFLDLGEAATTNPSGAMNFKREQADSLAGGHVIAVLDHDLAGYRRGLRLADLLGPMTASLRFALPRTTGHHQDAADHLDAGYGLEDFVAVDVVRLAQLEHVADAEDAANQARRAAAEATARQERAREAGERNAKSTVEREKRYAGRWAAEAGKFLVRAHAAYDAAAVDVEPEEQQRLVAAVSACQDAVTTAYSAAGELVPAETEPYLVAVTVPTVRTDEPDDELDDDESNGSVIHLRTATQLPAPEHTLPMMSRGEWAYETGGEGKRLRGVYYLPASAEARWQRVAPLPYVHARVQRRDGSGKPTGTFYLISATEAGPTVLIGHDDLRSHSWSNVLGLAIAQDDKVLRAATTALLFAAEDAELREATPRLEDGKISLPLADTMPVGYLATSDLAREDALDVWAQIVAQAARNPRLALALGASAVAPFISSLRKQPHVVMLFGDPSQGKTTTMRAAAAMWGYPGNSGDAVDSGVCLQWNATSLSVPAFLGNLGVLPAFMDEVGQAGEMKDSDWHQLVYNITQGAVRMTRARNKPGVELGLSWRGIFFSSGNSPMGSGSAGKHAGVPRRLVELGTPFTESREHSLLLDEMVQQAYGHLGHEIVARHSAETVLPFIEQAHQQLGGDYGTVHEIAMADHLTAHVAGAALVDQICGTNGLLTEAALLAAAEFLDECAPPPHDADRVLEEISDWIAREPGAWPTREQYQALKGPKTMESENLLPQHGFKVEYAGYIEDSGTVMVTNRAWKRMVEEHDIASKVALRALHERGLLETQDSRRRRGEWSIQSRVMGCTVYAIRLPEPEDLDEPTNTQPTAPDTGPVGGSEPPTLGVVGGGVGGANVPLTCGVGGVGGVGGDSSHVSGRARETNYHPRSEQDATAASGQADEVLIRLDAAVPCSACGEPTGYSIDGTPVHAGSCADQLTTVTEPETVPAPATAEPGAEPTSEAESAGSAQEPPADEFVLQPQTPRPGGREPRFAAPVAILEPELITLPGGRTVPWSAAECGHLGDVAMLASPDQLRLGHGGGEVLPEPGQLWVTSPQVMTALGFPGTLDLPDGIERMTPDDARREVQKALRAYESLPVVAEAVAQGWEISWDGHLDAWTRISHPEKFPRGAMVVFMPWARILDVPLIARASTAQQLADNLADAATVFGVQFKIHPGITAHNLINHTRPPRADDLSISGKRADRVALVRGQSAELPPFLRNPADSRFRSIEADFNWYRPWDTLMAHERELTTVAAFDRHASYLTEWETNMLGVDDLVHLTGSDAAWDGKSERAGYWLIERDFTWPQLLPPPTFGANVEGGANGRVWVTTPTLKAMQRVGIEPTVVEVWTWQTQARYLDIAAGRLKQGLLHPNAAVGATAKQLYARGSGRFARQKGAFAHDQLWRPDWYDHIKAWARFKILLAILHGAEQGVHPVAVARDTVVYLADGDAAEAWPGRTTQIGPEPGRFELEASGSAAAWGPAHLPTPPTGMGATWRHIAAIEALTQHKKRK